VKFSIVTISYNQSRFLEQAIRSVMEQDYPDIEYIVVDAGSTDGSREIIERYRNRITKVILGADSGPSDGLNKGFAAATGVIYGYLNADDILLPSTIKKVSSFFKCNTNIDVVSGHCYVIDEKGIKLQKAFSHRFDLRRYFSNSCVLIQQSTFFRSDIFNKTAGFNTKNHISWDGELFVEFALQKAKFAVAHDYWSCFRVYKESITGSSEYINKLNKEHIKIQKIIGYNGISELERKYLWVKGWLLQPRTLALRIFDGIINRDRLL